MVLGLHGEPHAYGLYHGDLRYEAKELALPTEPAAWTLRSRAKRGRHTTPHRARGGQAAHLTWSVRLVEETRALAAGGDGDLAAHPRELAERVRSTPPAAPPQVPFSESRTREGPYRGYCRAEKQEQLTLFVPTRRGLTNMQLKELWRRRDSTARGRARLRGGRFRRRRRTPG
jgi:hypothetical protein